ncbi:MAG TPA: EI24 domain-containing protein [Bacteroidia bacterium]|nr:EI24 domain-containing protein [Bacteroidia bacterium]
MGFWSDLGIGINTHVKAFKFIAKHSLWHYFIFPVLILAVLWVAGFWSIMGLSDWIVESALDALGLDATEEGWLGWVQAIVTFLVNIGLKIAFILFMNSYLKYIVLIVCSPILAILSERIDEIISGRTYPFNFGQFIKDMMRGILVTLRNMMLETLFILACFVIVWIPVVGLITIPILWFVSWYFMGFAMMDYTYERQKFTINQGAQYTRRHKGIAIGNGFIFSMILLIPFIGICIAPILSVVAATLAVLETNEEENKLRAMQMPVQS